MRVVVAQYGGPEVITTIEEEIPRPKAGEVRVKVLAAGVSLPDILAREGVHPETPRVPYTPGCDLGPSMVPGCVFCCPCNARSFAMVMRRSDCRANERNGDKPSKWIASGLPQRGSAKEYASLNASK